MAAEAMGALQAVLDRMMEGLERTRLRPMQKRGYLCCADCCDSAGPSPQALQACMLRCTEPATRAEQSTSAAVGEMQNRLTRCAARCEDLARQSVGADPTEKQAQAAQAKFVGCAKEQQSQIPKLEKEIEAGLGRA